MTQNRAAVSGGAAAVLTPRGGKIGNHPRQLHSECHVILPLEPVSPRRPPECPLTAEL